jgi:hypothetical protein
LRRSNANSTHGTGCIASKKRYFYGLHLRVVVTADGQLVEVLLVSAGDMNVASFQRLLLELQDRTTLFSYKSYIDYEIRTY